MIYCLTLNPSIDHLIYLDEVNLGQKNIMSDDRQLPGGKGINVSRIIHEFGLPVTNLGFIAGRNGQWIKHKLNQGEINHHFIEVDGETRRNLKIKAQEETEINGLGPFISPAQAQLLKEQVQQIKASDLVILSGSKAPGLSQSFYQELIKIIKEQGANFVIDTTGQELAASLEAQPLLVKPNRAELADLYQVSLETKEELITYGQQLIRDGAQYAIVSLGAKGALLFDQAKLYYAPNHKGQAVNSVGAGDSMLATFIAGYLLTSNPLEAFKWANAAGAATAFKEDLASLKEIEYLVDHVQIEHLGGF